MTPHSPPLSVTGEAHGQSHTSRFRTSRLTTRFLLAALLLTATPCRAGTQTAETLKETGEGLKYQCEGYDRMVGHAARQFDEFNGPRCYGYIQGVTEALNGAAFCLPLITLAQKVQTVQAFLSTHTARLKDDAVQLVIEALTEVYPCGKTPPEAR